MEQEGEGDGSSSSRSSPSPCGCLAVNMGLVPHMGLGGKPSVLCPAEVPVTFPCCKASD